MIISMHGTSINVGEPSSIKAILVNNDVGVVRLFVIQHNDSVEIHEVKDKGSTYSSAHYYTGVELDLFLKSKEKEALVFGSKEDESEFGYTVRFKFMNSYGHVRYDNKSNVLYIVIRGVVIKPDPLGKYTAYGYLPELFEDYIKDIDCRYVGLRYGVTVIDRVYSIDHTNLVFEFDGNIGNVIFKRNSDDTRIISYIGHTFEYSRDTELMKEKLGKNVANAIFDIL